MDEDPQTIPTYSLFSTKAIGVGTYLGGPLGGCILIAINFNRLGKPKQRNTALIHGLISTILLYWVIFSIPESMLDKIPNMLIPAIYTPILMALAHKFIGKHLKDHFEKKGRKGSGWAVFGYSVLSGVIPLAIAVWIAVAFSPFFEPYEFEGEIYNYGEQQSLIYHNTLDDDTLKAFGDYLIDTEYFSTEYQGIVQIYRLDSTYKVYLAYGKGNWADMEFIAYVKSVAQELEDTVLHMPVSIILVDEDLEQVYRQEL